MPRTMFADREKEVRDYRIKYPTMYLDWALFELDAERQVSKLLAESLKEMRDATAAMMRAMVKVCEPDMTDFITSEASAYIGFGKRASEALAKYREGL